MAVHYTLDGSLFRMDFKGEYTSNEVIRVFTQALDDPDFPSNARFLMNVAESSSLASRPAADIQRVADFLGPRAGRVGFRCAICAPKPVQFGMMRMAQVFGEDHGVETVVFSDEQKALEWLSASPGKEPT